MKTVNIENLKEILLMEKTHFEYKIRDGTLRKAYGTLQYVFIPEGKRHNDEYNDFLDSLRYFDLEKNDWRSITKDIKEVNVL